MTLSDITKKLQQIEDECTFKKNKFSDLQEQKNHIQQKINELRKDVILKKEQNKLHQTEIKKLERTLAQKRAQFLDGIEEKIRQTKNKIEKVEEDIAQLKQYEEAQAGVRQQHRLLSEQYERFKTALRVATYLKSRKINFSQCAANANSSPPGENFKERVKFLLETVRPILDQQNIHY